MGGEGGRRSPKIFFRPLGPQFGLKMKGKPGHSRAPSLDPPLKKQTNKQIGEVFLSISLERLNNALFGKEITVGLLLGLLRNAISLVSNLYLLVHKNLVTLHMPIVHMALFLIGQVCSQVWCRPYLATGFFELRTYHPRSKSKVEV